MRFARKGWRWVEIRASFDPTNGPTANGGIPSLLPCRPNVQAEMDALIAEAEALAEIEELAEDQQARFDAINARLDELDDRENRLVRRDAARSPEPSSALVPTETRISIAAS